MCGLTKSPKPQATPDANSPKKPPIYLHNLYLDGLGSQAERNGRNSLRIDPGSSRPTLPVSATPLTMGGSPAPSSSAASPTTMGGSPSYGDIVQMAKLRIQGANA